jgi:hypothetical protein
VDGYISKCIECQKVNFENQHPTIFIQQLIITEWKWEVVTIDFITKLPRVVKQHDSIMVVLNNITKVAHFVPLNVTHKE